MLAPAPREVAPLVAVISSTTWSSASARAPRTSPAGTITAVSPTASPVPPVSVVITGPPPASIFSVSAMPNVSTKSGSGLVGSAYAAQPRHEQRLLVVVDVVEQDDAVVVPHAGARISASAGPVPATTSLTRRRARDRA